MRLFTGSAKTEAARLDRVDQAMLAPTEVLDDVLELHPGRLATRPVDDMPGLRTAPSAVPPFDVRGQARSGMIRLRLSGTLDLDAGPVIDVWLRQAERSPTRVVVIDLRDLTCITKAGFAICLRARDSARRSGLRLFLANGGPDVRRLVELTGTQDLFADPNELRELAASRGDEERGWSPMMIPREEHGHA